MILRNVIRKHVSFAIGVVGGDSVGRPGDMR